MIESARKAIREGASVADAARSIGCTRQRLNQLLKEETPSLSPVPAPRPAASPSPAPPAAGSPADQPGGGLADALKAAGLPGGGAGPSPAGPATEGDKPLPSLQKIDDGEYCVQQLKTIKGGLVLVGGLWCHIPLNDPELLETAKLSPELDAATRSAAPELAPILKQYLGETMLGAFITALAVDLGISAARMKLLRDKYKPDDDDDDPPPPPPGQPEPKEPPRTTKKENWEKKALRSQNSMEPWMANVKPGPG